MELVLVSAVAFLLACLVNFFYWKPRFTKLDKKLFDTQKSYYRSIDISRKQKDKIIKLKNAEEKWEKFLQGEG